MRIGIVIRRVGALDATWTTVHLASAMLRRGHVVHFVEGADFEVDPRGALLARAHSFVAPGPDIVEIAGTLAQRNAPRTLIDVAGLDMLLLRCAPLDPTVLTFALLAQDRGIPVLNDPRGLLLVSHKAWLASLPDVASPPTLVTRSEGTALLFHEAQPAGSVVKPARGSGGRLVFLVEPGDRTGLVRAVREVRNTGDGYAVVQRYLEAADEGEKRLVWLDGAIIGGYLRQRPPGEFRHNLKRGGLASPADITDGDRRLARSLTPHLLSAGIRIAGLDVIGGRITEVNALNPGGTFHADRLTGSHLAEAIIERLEKTPPAPRSLETNRWVPPVP